MKQKIVFALVFLVIFANITIAMIYLNSKYNNIFALDFSPAKNPSKTETGVMPEEEKVTALKAMKEEIKAEIMDSLDARGIFDLADKKGLIEDLEQMIADKKVKNSSDNSSTKKDYKQWTTKTADLYESMEPDKAAKILEKYTDNVAKDIIFAMNKKKAAKILSNLNPELASQITLAN